MKKLVIITLFISLSFCAKAQEKIEWGIKAGVGTSWAAFPKVFLQDANDAFNTWEIAPATNNVTFYVGAEMILNFGKNHAIRTEIGYNYVSGEVSITETLTGNQVRELQSYSRISLPVLLMVKSNDSFWFSLGPNFYFNIGDNNGLVDAIAELNPVPKIDASFPFGVGVRLAADIRLQDNLYLEVKFDYDIGKHFDYIEDTDIYDVKMAMQGLTGGLTYLF